MKLLLVLAVCAVAAAAPRVHKVEPLHLADLLNDVPLESKSFVVNQLVKQLFTYLRFIIKNGSAIFGFPPLDPLDLEQFHLEVPAGLINLELGLKKIYATGLGDFVVNSSNLNLRALTFELDMTVPKIEISADEYDLIGDLFTAIPLYGKGKANFIVDEFRFHAKLLLKQSDDGKSVLIDEVADLSFVIPSLKTELTGAIGGGDIDAIVNAIIDEVVFDYIHRFRGAISLAAAKAVPAVLNPLLERVDTWKYIAPLMPSKV